MGRLAPSLISPAEPLEQGMVTFLTAECIIRQLASNEASDHATAACGKMNSLKVNGSKAKGPIATAPGLHAAQLTPAGSGTDSTRLTRGLDLPAGDWDALFRAVQVRLKTAIGDLCERCSEESRQEILGTTQRIVIECMAALDSLHSSLTHERDLQEQFEVAVFNAQSDLAKALGAIANLPSDCIGKASSGTAPAQVPYAPLSTRVPIDPVQRPSAISYAPLYGALMTARTHRQTSASRLSPQGATSGESSV